MPAAETAATAYKLCVLSFPELLPEKNPWPLTIDAQTPCHNYCSRSRSHSPDNNGGALNLDIKSTKATTSTTSIEDEEVTYERSSPKAIESSELRSRLQEVSHGSTAGEPMAAHWRRQRYDSTEARSPTIEVENDSEEPEPYNLHNVNRKATHKDNAAAVAVPTSAVAEDQPLPQPKNNEQISHIFKASPPISHTMLDPMALYYFQQRQHSAFFHTMFPHHSLFHIPPVQPRSFADEGSSQYQKDLPSDPRQPSPSRTTPPKVIPWHPTRVDPPSHPHQSSAAVASMH